MEATTQVKPQIEESWLNVLKDEFDASYFSDLKQFLVEEKQKHRIFPPGKSIFNAFNHIHFDEVKVVILGQDPYHGLGQAHGLCFSVPKGVQHPPSLVNVFKEIQDDLGIPYPQSGNLEPWAKQGVLLLNATLTVRAHQAGSHQNKGWETFTDAAITALSQQREGVVFLLWGKYAKAKEELIDTTKHHVLKSTHPSPFSVHYGFFGCKHFSKANAILRENSRPEIDWRVE
ncbi:MAG: uracil-DNA glycosylase [Flavobacteriales bacterium]|nr:MAG: uracil-DNA glycosylase [Flavobacteriales bacterium]